MKKKLLSLALALVMCLGLMVPVSAVEARTNSLYDGNIFYTLDPDNGTLNFTGTGELTCDDFEHLTRKILRDTPSEITTATINIGAGITIDDESKYDAICAEIREFSQWYYGVETINTNRNVDIPLPPSKFTDVAANSPYREAIDWAVEDEITKGTTATTFGPNQTCTVSHILTFILRYTNNIEPDRELISGHCEELSQVLGMPGLKPDQPCTRALAVQLLYVVHGGSTAPSTAFSDVPSNSGLLAEAVAWAVKKGITQGTSATTFSPNNICTRGQIVTFLYRLDKA